MADSRAEARIALLTVATVKLQSGLRARKLIGSAVYNDQNQKVGSIDGLIVKDGDKIVMAIVSIGGFLGIGGINEVVGAAGCLVRLCSSPSCRPAA